MTVSLIRRPYLRLLAMLCPISLIMAAGVLRADPTVPAAPDLPTTNLTAPTRETPGSRPDHLWTVDYLDLLWSDTGAILTAPARWDQNDWLEAGLAGAAVGGTAAFDKTVKDRVQAHRTAGEDRFMKQFQNFGSVWSFGVIGAFEVWGEADGDVTAKNAAMDALTASIIGPGLIGTGLKEAVGRVRPNSATQTFEFRSFSGNQSFPSGHTFQAFTVATAIAENYHAWWVQVLCYGSAGLVGYARIEQNAHYASDVIAGALLGWSITRGIARRHDAPNPKRINWAPYTDGTHVGIVVFKSY